MNVATAKTTNPEDGEQHVVAPWELDREEEALLNNFVYLWRQENFAGDSLQLTFDNDSSSRSTLTPLATQVASLPFYSLWSSFSLGGELSESHQRRRSVNECVCMKPMVEKRASEGQSTARERRGSHGGEFVIMESVAEVLKVGHGSKVKQKGEAQGWY